jgi:hypothetical protein
LAQEHAFREQLLLAGQRTSPAQTMQYEESREGSSVAYTPQTSAIMFQKVDVSFVMVLTSKGNGCTTAIEHRMAAADVYSAEQAG